MNQIIEAIFENGVFRPLQPVNLPENARVQVSVQDDKLAPLEIPAAELAKQQDGIRRMLEETAAFPSQSPPDGFSGRDHDKILYGKP